MKKWPEEIYMAYNNLQRFNFCKFVKCKFDEDLYEGNSAIYTSTNLEMKVVIDYRDLFQDPRARGIFLNIESAKQVMEEEIDEQIKLLKELKKKGPEIV